MLTIFFENQLTLKPSFFYSRISQQLGKLIVSTGIGLFSISTNAQAAEFNFTKVVDSQGGFVTPFAAPALNDKGTVVFTGVLNSTENFALIKVEGPAVTTIADDKGSFSVLFNPAVTNRGLVAFEAILDDGSHGIFTNKGGKNIPAITAPGRDTLAGFDINSKEDIAFFSNSGGETSDRGVFTIENGRTKPIATSEHLWVFAGTNSVPSINEKDEIAFIHQTDVLVSRGKSLDALFTLKGTSFAAFLRTPQKTAINNQGTVAFIVGWKDAEKESVATVQKGTLKIIATLDTKKFGNLDSFAINDEGTVVFSTVPNDLVPYGIYRGPNLDTDKVIVTGNKLFGSKVKSVRFSEQGLNNLGQIAFLAELEDGTSGIFVASPNSKPIEK